MDRETQDMFERIEVQLKRVAHAIEVHVGNQVIERLGKRLGTPCVSCDCLLLSDQARRCPVCGTPKKET